MPYKPLPPGAIVDKQYEIQEVLGSGGFGIAYKAHDRSLDHVVVLKEYYPRDLVDRDGEQTVTALRHTVETAPPGFEAPSRPFEIDATTAIQYMRPEQASDVFAWGRRRFFDEAQTLARLRHPSILQIFRVFEANNTAYIAMDYVQGELLSRVAEHWNGAPSQAQIDALLEPLLDALALLHENGIVHRDFAPKNVIVNSKGQPVLLDFGSARKFGASEIAGDEFIVVSPPYSAPELYVHGSMAKPPADLYGVAVMAYQMISGKSVPDAFKRLTSDTVEPIAKLAKGNYRPDFLRAIDWGLALAIDKRPQSVREWLAGLFPWRNLAGRNALNRLRGRKVFISYRRSDSSQAATAIHRAMANRFGTDEVFFDIDSIPYGVDFRNHIRGSILESAVLLAVIGPGWAPSLKASWWQFWRKPVQDFVRTELELAMEAGVPILPVLVNGAHMPDAKLLPPTLAEMMYNNAVTLNADTVDADVGRIANAIHQFRD